MDSYGTGNSIADGQYKVTCIMHTCALASRKVSVLALWVKLSDSARYSPYTEYFLCSLRE